MANILASEIKFSFRVAYFSEEEEDGNGETLVKDIKGNGVVIPSFGLFIKEKKEEEKKKKKEEEEIGITLSSLSSLSLPLLSSLSLPLLSSLPLVYELVIFVFLFHLFFQKTKSAKGQIFLRSM